MDVLDFIRAKSKQQKALGHTTTAEVLNIMSFHFDDMLKQTQDDTEAYEYIEKCKPFIDIPVIEMDGADD